VSGAPGWGFVGTGSICRTVAADLRLLGTDRLVAASSRDQARAQAFCDDLGAEAATGYGSVTDLVADPRVDIVYVGTPHAQHAAAVRIALLAGKAVLCEKAMTVSVADTAELIALARERGVFLMEAVWMRFNPLIARLGSLIADGAIGRLHHVAATFGFPAPYDPQARLWDPGQGGGALLDMGVYPVNFAQLLLGTPDTVQVVGSRSPEGIDAAAGLALSFPEGAMAQLSCSLLAPLAGTAQVAGSTGRIDLAATFLSPTAMTLHRDGAQPEQFRIEPEGAGYVPELREVESRVAAGQTESTVMPLQDSLTVAEIISQALDTLGVRYP